MYEGEDREDVGDDDITHRRRRHRRVTYDYEGR